VAVILGQNRADRKSESALIGLQQELSSYYQNSSSTPTALMIWLAAAPDHDHFHPKGDNAQCALTPSSNQTIHHAGLLPQWHIGNKWEKNDNHDQSTVITYSDRRRLAATLAR
jgi:hypothetical protein